MELNLKNIKICSKCKEEKDLNEFGNDKRRKDGKQSACYECYRILDKKRYNTERRKKYCKENQSDYYQKNKKKCNERNKKWHENNPEKSKIIYERYRKIKRKPIIRKWTNEKRKIDINYKIISYIRNRMFKSLKNKKQNKTIGLLGCSIAELKQWLGIINNYDGKMFHLDHIIAVSLYDLSKKSEQLKAFNYRNLRLCLAKENISKSNKIDFDLIKFYGIEDLLPENFI